MSNSVPAVTRSSDIYEFPTPPTFADPARRAKLERAIPEIRQAFQEYQEQQHIPGLAFGVVMDGEQVAADAFGVRHVESDAPATSDTVFRIASMSKSFVAMAILKLRDEKKLWLDAPVAEHIPELANLRYPTADSPDITIRHLLTMSSGFPEDNPWGDRQMAIGDETFAAWLRAGIPFANAPDMTFEYSNYGYAILGRVVTRVAGVDFQEYISENILKPLGMNATVWDKKNVPPDRLAQGYRYEADLESGVFGFRPEPILADGAFAAMAGLFTTIPDFCRYMSFLLDAFPPRDSADSGRPVTRATAREMQQMARFEELVERKAKSDRIWRSVSGYGYGLAIWHDERFGHGVSHGGGLPGFGSYYYLLADYGIGIVALSNKTYSRVGMIFSQLFEVFERTGGLQPRRIAPAPVLEKMRMVVQQWLDGGDDGELVAAAADNFFLDRDMAHRRAELNQIRSAIGMPLHHGEFTALNALRGKWRVAHEGGWVDVLLTLAPTMPPTIQYLTLTPGKEEPT